MNDADLGPRYAPPNHALTMARENAASPAEFATETIAVRDPDIEAMARAICDSYYMTVDPDRPLLHAWDKITAKTREHWRAQARLLTASGWRRE